MLTDISKILLPLNWKIQDRSRIRRYISPDGIFFMRDVSHNIYLGNTSNLNAYLYCSHSVHDALEWIENYDYLIYSMVRVVGEVLGNDFEYEIDRNITAINCKKGSLKLTLRHRLNCGYVSMITNTGINSHFRVSNSYNSLCPFNLACDKIVMIEHNKLSDKPNKGVPYTLFKSLFNDSQSVDFVSSTQLKILYPFINNAIIKSMPIQIPPNLSGYLKLQLYDYISSV